MNLANTPGTWLPDRRTLKNSRYGCLPRGKGGGSGPARRWDILASYGSGNSGSAVDDRSDLITSKFSRVIAWTSDRAFCILRLSSFSTMSNTTIACNSCISVVILLSKSAILSVYIQIPLPMPRFHYLCLTAQYIQILILIVFYLRSLDLQKEKKLFLNLSIILDIE